jgi:hypothetical protein
VEVLEGYFEGRYGEKYLKKRHDPEQTQEGLERLFTPVEREAVRLVREDPQKRRVLLIDALESYLKNHDNGEQDKFAKDTCRAIQHVITSVGDLPLEAYKRGHANRVLKFLIAKGSKTATVRRELNRIKAVFNVGLREFDLWEARNPSRNSASPMRVKMPKSVSRSRRMSFRPSFRRVVRRMMTSGTSLPSKPTQGRG